MLCTASIIKLLFNMTYHILLYTCVCLCLTGCITAWDNTWDRFFWKECPWNQGFYRMRSIHDNNMVSIIKYSILCLRKACKRKILLLWIGSEDNHISYYYELKLPNIHDKSKTYVLFKKYQSLLMLCFRRTACTNLTADMLMFILKVTAFTHLG